MVNIENKHRVSPRQLGLSGLERQGNYVYEEFLPELRWPYASRIYKEMSYNDPVIGSILYLAEMLIRGTTWSVKPASESEADVAAAKFLEECMHDMDRSWAETISEILSMFIYGFSFHEVVYKVRRGSDSRNVKFHSKYSDGRIGWRRIPIRAQSSFHEWEFDEEGDVKAFVQMSPPTYAITSIPMKKGLLFRTRVSKDNPEGKSLLRNAYRPWFFKKHLEEIEGIGIERDLAGFPVLQAPPDMDLWNNEDPVMVNIRNTAETLVQSVRRDSEEGILLPHGWNLSLLSSTSTRQVDIGKTIERYDNRIAITMLSDIVLIGNNSSTGSFALADTKQSTLAASLQSQLQNIADVFNSKAVRDLFRYNTFDGITELPTIVPGNIHTPSLKEVALILRSMNLNIANDMELQNHLRHMLNVPSVSKETFDEVYRFSDTEGNTSNSSNSNNDNLFTEAGVNADDTLNNVFEQSDLAYTGGN